MTNKTFAIVGGGIAGLTLAIALQRKGLQVTVYENAPQLKPLGAGLVLAANAMKAFTEIGISDQVIQAGKLMNTFRIKDLNGDTITETSAARLNKKFGTVNNNFTIHRADLHTVLQNLLKPDTIQLGKGCIDFEQHTDHVTLQFQDGSSAFADYVIACDGIHSAIRKKLLPETHPRYAGYTCWRAVIDSIPEGINPDESTETWGPGSRFGIVPLNNNRLYWFACVDAKEKDPQMKNMNVEQLRNAFKNFHAPVQAILENTKNENIIWSDIIDIKPISKFAFGNIVLAGDAAHATTPNMGQGACMAIEDAAVLANCISQHVAVEEAFKAFEKKRMPRTHAIVKTSWRIGKMAHLKNPFLVSVRNFALSKTPASITDRQIKFLTDVTFS